MRTGAKLWISVTALGLVLTGLVHAQNSPSSGAPMPSAGPMAAPSRDPAAAPQGAYNIDLEHSSVVARVPHRGMSFNVVRFGVSHGALRWNPADPSTIALNVRVDARPYYAPIVYKITPDGTQGLNIAKFPEATFVSTAVHVKDGRRAAIEGSLTLMGVTKPVVIDAELVGVGKSMEGVPTIGFTGTMIINWGDFSQQPMARMVGNVTIVLDAEFLKS